MAKYRIRSLTSQAAESDIFCSLGPGKQVFAGFSIKKRLRCKRHIIKGFCASCQRDGLPGSCLGIKHLIAYRKSLSSLCQKFYGFINLLSQEKLTVQIFSFVTIPCHTFYVSS